MFKNAINEFKEFAIKGNMVDLAVGIIIGTSFNKVVTSLVSDIILPPIGLLLNKVDFSNLFVTLGTETYPTLAEAQKAGAATVNYGLFVNTLITFVVTAFAVFLIVRLMNQLRRRREAAKAPTSTTKRCPFCDSEISLNAKRCPNCTSTL